MFPYTLDSLLLTGAEPPFEGGEGVEGLQPIWKFGGLEKKTEENGKSVNPNGLCSRIDNDCCMALGSKDPIWTQKPLIWSKKTQIIL